jgi:16S rRNA U516 pseudouridylate synthase RsuA-like enzyme
MDEDNFNLDIRKFLKEVGVTSQREIEKIVREGKVRGNVLRLRMTLSSETAPLSHVVEGEIRLD